MLCPPVQCCCASWRIGPGETIPLVLNWAHRLGLGFNAVSSDAELVLANAGLAVTDAEVLPNDSTMVMIEAAPDAPLGVQHRLNLTLTARDCDGHEARLRTCVSVTVTRR